MGKWIPFLVAAVLIAVILLIMDVASRDREDDNSSTESGGREEEANHSVSAAQLEQPAGNFPAGGCECGVFWLRGRGRRG